MLPQQSLLTAAKLAITKSTSQDLVISAHGSCSRPAQECPDDLANALHFHSLTTRKLISAKPMTVWHSSEPAMQGLHAQTTASKTSNTSLCACKANGDLKSVSQRQGMPGELYMQVTNDTAPPDHPPISPNEGRRETSKALPVCANANRSAPVIIIMKELTLHWLSHCSLKCTDSCTGMAHLEKMTEWSKYKRVSWSGHHTLYS